MYSLDYRNLTAVDLSYTGGDSFSREPTCFLGECRLNDVMIRFGEKLRAIRLRVGVSQEKLADLAGLHRTYVSTVERGKKNVSLQNIEKFAEALDVEMSELMPERVNQRGQSASSAKRRPARS
jgi:DNA-binding XRE family transcriptional regulator